MAKGRAARRLACEQQQSRAGGRRIAPRSELQQQEEKHDADAVVEQRFAGNRVDCGGASIRRCDARVPDYVGIAPVFVADKLNEIFR